MTLAALLSLYFSLNLMVVLAFGFLKIAQRYIPSSRQELKLHYFILASIFVLSVTQIFFPRPAIFEPPAKVWSAGSIKDFPDEFSAADKGGYLLLPGGSSQQAIEADKISVALFWVMLLITLGGLWRVGKDAWALARITRLSFLTRKIGRAAIYLSDDLAVPFSYRFPFRAAVVMPRFILEKPEDYRIAMAHEIQHHRQGDTTWLYVMWGLRILCAPNPIIHLWSRWLSELQEFACDEALVDRKKAEPQQYARCLIEVAEKLIHLKTVPVCATGLSFQVGHQLLKRRIEKMLTSKKTIIGRKTSLILGAVAVTLMTGVALASNGMVQDRRVTLADAERMAVQTQKSDFPVVINEQVLTQLNRFIGTPEGRQYMRDSLARMKRYQSFIQQKTTEHGLPENLLAIPIIESSYLNMKQKNSKYGAGLWMFMQQTARRFGLTVDEKVDDRLDYELETEVAMQYLKQNHQKFGDWQLAVVAYNAGEVAVEKAIKQTGSQDVWFLLKNGLKTDKDYLPKLIAAILIMNNPDSVQ